MAMSIGERRAVQAERRAARERLDRIAAGLADEVECLNEALRAGREVRVPAACGSMCAGLLVDRVTYGADGLWVVTKGYGGRYAFANDGRWAELLRAAGVERDPRAEGR